MRDEPVFDIERFRLKNEPSDQYERQLQRLIESGKGVVCIEQAIRGAITNIAEAKSRSFVIYGEPQSGKTEMMICLTARLIDEGHQFIVHLLNDSVDLLGQNLGRFKASGLAPAAKNFSEILDPAVKLEGQPHVIFCKKNGSDLRKLLEKAHSIRRIVVIDDEADYASPNSRINSSGKTPINDLIGNLIGDDGLYIGVTATPARLDLNNTFDNDSESWVDFPPHSKYTGQDVFFPLEGKPGYYLTLLPNSGSDPRYAREALFGFLVNASYANLYVNGANEKNYSILVHTSGKKADHKSDWNTMHSALVTLITRTGGTFSTYTKYIWELTRKRFSDADPDRITSYILANVARHAIITLNSERDWKDNASAATSPTSLFTIIIGGNIVSRGVTLDNLLAMFFTRDVKHKIQQDTYIQRARMFGSRGDYLSLFELTIPEALYLDWHRCFVFHRLALAAIKSDLGSLVWIGDQRIQSVSSSSIDRSTVDLDRGEMSFSIFRYDDSIEVILSGSTPSLQKLEYLSTYLGNVAFPDYLKRYIVKTSPNGSTSIAVHQSLDISGYAEGPDIDKEHVTRRRGFLNRNQLDPDKFPGVVHHIIVIRNGDGSARLFYKFVGSLQFVRNAAHDPRL